MRGTRALVLGMLLATSACGILLGASGDDTPAPPASATPVEGGLDGATDVPPAPDPFDAAGGEDADVDASLAFDAGPDADASAIRIAFVTAKKTSGSFGATYPLAQLEAACAKAAPAPFATRKFTPLVEYAGSSAASRLTQGPAWRRLDGTKVLGGDPKDLAGGFLAPLNLTSAGTTIGAGEHVWVGLSPSTTPVNCLDWTTTGKLGQWGDPSATGTTALNAGTITCTTLAYLYCFEQ